jgi:hypothetical protein
MSDPIIQRSVGLKQTRWLWLDALARASGDTTSELVRKAVESFLLNSVGADADVSGGDSTGAAAPTQRGAAVPPSERATGSILPSGASSSEDS